MVTVNCVFEQNDGKMFLTISSRTQRNNHTLCSQIGLKGKIDEMKKIKWNKQKEISACERNITA